MKSPLARVILAVLGGYLTLLEATPEKLKGSIKRMEAGRDDFPLLNAKVLAEHHNGPVEAFLSFLDETGIEKKNFVIADTRGLHACIYRWFPALNRQILEKYQTLIVFR